MFQLAKPFFLHCETPLHAGAGNGIGTELPIQREEHTRFPKIESSGLKGSLREVFEAKKTRKGMDDDLIAIFGHPSEGDEGAGALGLTDARLLLFPVRSRQAVFAWVTCPRVLKRFIRDLEVSAANGGGAFVRGLLAKTKAAPKDEASVCSNSAVGKNGQLWLEEYSFKPKPATETDELAAALAKLLDIDDLAAQFAIIPDDYFSDFVQQGTEMHTRIRIGVEGVVAEGALFTEEHLPAESVLYSLVLAQPELRKGGKTTAAEILALFTTDLPEFMQIGGNATLGKGIIRVTKTLLQ